MPAVTAPSGLAMAYEINYRKNIARHDSSTGWCPRSQPLHLRGAWQLGWSLVWNNNLRSMERPRSLLKQLGPVLKLDLIKDKSLRGDQSDCETDHERA